MARWAGTTTSILRPLRLGMRGTPPLEGDVLGVFSAPAQRSAATITYQLRGDKVGKYANIAELTSSTFAGTNIVVAPVQVVEP